MTISNDRASQNAIDEIFNNTPDQNSFPDGSVGSINIKAIVDAVLNEIKSNGIVTGVCPSGGGPLTNGKVI